MPTQKENEIQQDVREYLQWRGWYVIRNQQSLGSHRGLADLTAIKDGRVVFIEIKTPEGRLSRHQRNFRDEILSHGGEYIVIRSLDEIMKWEKTCLPANTPA